MKPMKGFVLIGLLVIVVSAYGQKEFGDRASWRDRIYTGGGFGFNAGTDRFGNRYFNFSVSPIVGYMVTQQFSTGAGVSYQRVSYPDMNFAYEQYGIMPFVRYNFNDFFLTAEYDYINLPQLDASYKTINRIYRSRLLAGAGYTQPLGSRARLNAVAMYDLLYRRPSLFNSPWVFRVFISF